MSKQTIWNFFRAKGLSQKATAALMGNIEAESTFFAPRVQGDFTAGYTKSILYTSQVDDGVISRYDFINGGPGGGGYGLVQFTYYTRKAGLYDKARREQKSIGDEELQCEYIWEELNSNEYSSVLHMLNSNVPIWDMTASVLRKYERPADMSDAAVAYRSNLAQAIFNEFATEDDQIPVPDQPEPDVPSHEIESCEVVHRVLYTGDIGRDVLLLQAGLIDMGYDLSPYGADGAFGSVTEQMVKKMQADCNIHIDGIAGKDTWQIIFQ